MQYADRYQTTTKTGTTGFCRFSRVDVLPTRVVSMAEIIVFKPLLTSFK